MLKSLERLGIKDIRYRILVCAAKIIVIIRRIVKLTKAEKAHEMKVDNFLKQDILPNFRLEVAMLEKGVIDGDLIEHSRKLKRHLQELESLV